MSLKSFCKASSPSGFSASNSFDISLRREKRRYRKKMRERIREEKRIKEKRREEERKGKERRKRGGIK